MPAVAVTARASDFSPSLLRTGGYLLLSSTATLVFRKFVAQSADNFSMKRRNGGRQFKSALLEI